MVTVQQARGWRFGLAIATVAFFTFVRIAAAPHLGPSDSFILYAPGIALIAWFAGVGPALLCAVLAVGAGALFLVDEDDAEPLLLGPLGRLLAFFFACLCVAVATHIFRVRREHAFTALAKRQRDTHLNVLAGLPDAVIAADAQGCVTYMNPMAEVLTGFSRERARGRALDEIVRLRDDDTHETVPASSRTDGALPAALADRVSVLGPNGVWCAVSDRGAPLALPGAAQPGIVLTLRKSPASARDPQLIALTLAAVGAGTDALVGVSDENRIALWNEGAVRLFGLPSTSMLGADPYLLMPHALRRELDRILDAARSGERIADRDLTMLGGTGRRLEVSVSAVPVCATAPDSRVVALSVRNIGKRRDGERRLRDVGAEFARRARELQTLIDIAPVGIALSVGADCGSLRPNRLLAQMLGVSATEPLHDLCAYRGKSALAGRDLPMHQALAQGRRVDGVELELESREGGRIVALASATPVLDTDGAIAGCIGVFADVSPLPSGAQKRDVAAADARAARADAEAALKVRDECLGMVAHELRTPLNAIEGWTEIMRCSDDPAQQRRGLEVITRNVSLQRRMIDDLFDISSMLAGKTRLRRRPLDLGPLLAAAAESVRPLAARKGIALEVTLAPDEPGTGARVVGDADRLQQVAGNLLANAVKFTPVGGRIGLRLTRLADEVEFEVSDTGEGIDPAFITHVFDKFRQADSSARRTHDGLGLGLAIVRELVAPHGGSVRVDSGGRGRGSAFTVSLPLATHAPEAARRRASAYSCL